MTKFLFYRYTLHKMAKSVSTYIIASIVFLPLWIWALSRIGSTDSIGSTASIIAFISFPLTIVFITFKVSQIFRDEIENQTLLSIASKPISRLSMVLEGYLSIFTMIVIVSFGAIFIPVSLTGINAGSESVKKAILMTITNILLGSIVSSIALLLSLKVRAKAFVGIMLGGFGTGFYILFGLMVYLRMSSSSSSIADSFVASSYDDKDELRKEKYKISGVAFRKNESNIFDQFNDNSSGAIYSTDPASISVSNGYNSGNPLLSFVPKIGETKDIKNYSLTLDSDYNIYSIKVLTKAVADLKHYAVTPTNKANKANALTMADEIEKVIKQNKLAFANIKEYIETLSKQTGTYDYLKWIDPVGHWEKMFSANSSTEAPKSTGDMIMSMIFDGQSSQIGDVHLDKDGTIESFDLKTIQTIPLWFPYLLWIALGAIIIPLSIRSLAKRNIS